MTAEAAPKRASYRDQKGGRSGGRRTSYRAEEEQSTLLNLTGKSLAIVLAVGVAAVAVLGFVVYRMVFTPKLDTLAFKDRLVSVNQGDLPAPPFIGWEQAILEEPPAKLKPNKAIKDVNVEECTPGGKRQAEVAGLIMNKATQWSGTEMYNTAYNAHIRIDASNANDRSDGRNGGLDYGLVDSFLHDCSYIEFTQEADGKSKTVRITHQPLNIDLEAWDMSDGRAWVQTVATSTPEGYEGATSTITTLGHGRGSTLQAQLTFEGRTDQNAVNTMDLLWTAQTLKAFR